MISTSRPFPVLATGGMCATSHPLGAKAAIDVLERGGNAMDAAIAGAVLLGICEPQMTGIGGDCFVLWSEAGSNEVHALNGSGRAPAALDAAQLRDAGETTVPVILPMPSPFRVPLTHFVTCPKHGRKAWA